MLAGLNPEQILEIATRCISFYTYQLSYGEQLKQHEMQKYKEAFLKLKSHCQELKVKFQMSVQQLHKQATG